MSSASFAMVASAIGKLMTNHGLSMPDGFLSVISSNKSKELNSSKKFGILELMVAPWH